MVLRKGIDALLRIRKTADYQFGKDVGEAIFPDRVEIGFSKQTARIRHIFLDGELLATLRPTDGMLSLTVHGAKRIVAEVKTTRYWVRVRDDVSSFIAKGKSVFSKHVVDVDKEIRPREEVIVLNGGNRVLAVGRAVLTGQEMNMFKHGVAVRVRKGVKEDAEES